MIFPTLAEGNRVMNKIANYEEFEELKPNDKFVMACMYSCLQAVENVYDEYEEDEDAKDVLEQAFTYVVVAIADVYVSITDNDEDYWEK